MSNIILENGTYEGKIIKAYWRESEYQIRPNNPLGECLSLWIDINHNGLIKRVFSDISIADKTRISQLMDSAGVSETPELTNKKLNLAVEKYTSKVGKVSNIVKTFLPAKLEPKTLAKKKSKVEAPFDTDDNHVPF